MRVAVNAPALRWVHSYKKVLKQQQFTASIFFELPAVPLSENTRLKDYIFKLRSQLEC